MKKSFKYALAIGIIKKAVLLIFIFSNYSFSQEFEIDGNEMSVVFSCPDTDADLLFSKINLAVANIYNSANDVIQMNNPKTRQLVIKGTIVKTEQSPYRYLYPLAAAYMDLTNDIKYNYTLNIETRDNRYKASVNVSNGEIYNSRNPTIPLGKTELNDMSESEITGLFISDIKYFDAKEKYPKSKKKKVQWNEFMYYSKENYRTRPPFVREYLQSALLSLQAKVLESTISDGDDW